MLIKTSVLVPIITIRQLGIPTGKEFYFLVVCHRISKRLALFSWQRQVTVYCYILFLIFTALERQCFTHQKWNYSIVHLFNKMARKTQGLGFEPTEIIPPFANHASHPVFQETYIKSHPGCLHREAGKQ